MWMLIGASATNCLIYCMLNRKMELPMGLSSEHCLDKSFTAELPLHAPCRCNADELGEGVYCFKKAARQAAVGVLVTLVMAVKDARMTAHSQQHPSPSAIDHCLHATKGKYIVCAAIKVHKYQIFKGIESCRIIKWSWKCVKCLENVPNI